MKKQLKSLKITSATISKDQGFKFSDRLLVKLPLTIGIIKLFSYSANLVAGDSPAPEIAEDIADFIGNTDISTVQNVALDLSNNLKEALGNTYNNLSKDGVAKAARVTANVIGVISNVILIGNCLKPKSNEKALEKSSKMMKPAAISFIGAGVLSVNLAEGLRGVSQYIAHHFISKSKDTVPTDKHETWASKVSKNAGFPMLFSMSCAAILNGVIQKDPTKIVSGVALGIANFGGLLKVKLSSEKNTPLDKMAEENNVVREK